MDLTDFRAEVLTRLNVPSTNPMFPAAALDSAINDALQHIAGVREWPWLRKTATIPTVAGQVAYSLPADFARDRSLAVDGRHYVAVTDLDLDVWDRYGAVEHERYVWARTNGGFEIRPAPTAIVDMSLRYVSAEPRLTAGSDAPLLPDRHAGVVTDWAAAIMFMRAGNVAEADFSRASYRERERRMLTDANRGAKTKRVRVRPGSAL